MTLRLHVPAVRRYAARHGKRVVVWHAADYTKDGQAITDKCPPVFARVLLELSDQKSNNTPGVTVYADDAGSMVGMNFATEIGLAKGTRGKYAGFVPDPRERPDDGEGEEWRLTYRPLALLFRPDDPRHDDLPGMENGVVPIPLGADPLDKVGARDERVLIECEMPAALRPYMKKKAKSSNQNKFAFKREGFVVKQGMVASVSWVRNAVAKSDAPPPPTAA